MIGSKVKMNNYFVLLVKLLIKHNLKINMNFGKFQKGGMWPTSHILHMTATDQ